MPLTPPINFNPRPPRGGRRSRQSGAFPGDDFNPRPPRGGRQGFYILLHQRLYFNPRPPRGGRRREHDRETKWLIISIHAPREGGDTIQSYDFIHIPQFQSTPPARGATPTGWEYPLCAPNFNPRPPRGGRRLCVNDRLEHLHFNPRPPRGGRRRHRQGADRWHYISIHAPREGGDDKVSTAGGLGGLFQSTPPRGGRLRDDLHQPV